MVTFKVRLVTKKITISPSDWMPLTHLHYEGLEVSYPNIPEHLNYERESTLNSMLRLEFQSQGLRNIASLTVDDRLLHYVYVHILRQRSTNFVNCFKKTFLGYEPSKIIY